MPYPTILQILNMATCRFSGRYS